MLEDQLNCKSSYNFHVYRVIAPLVRQSLENVSKTSLEIWICSQNPDEKVIFGRIFG